MRKLPLIFLIILLTFTQGVQPFMFASDKEMDSQPKLDINVDPEATNHHTVVALLTENSMVDEVHIKLPVKSTYDQEQTSELNQQNIDFQYEENKHLLKVAWEPGSQESEIKFVLIDLETAENNIQATGFIEDEKIIELEKTFQVKLIEENNETAVETNIEESEQVTDKQVTEEKNNNTFINKEDEVEEKKKTDKEKKATDKKLVKENTRESTTTQTKRAIQSFVGDLNVDIDISPYKEEVESGKTAMYNLVFKTTGSQKEYNNAKIVVDLPINDYTAFNQDVNELKIAGVVPTYDTTNHTLTYEFDKLKTGQTYDVIIKVETKNGYTPNGTKLEAKASFESDEREKVQGEALVTVISSSAISVNKMFTGEVWNGVEGEWQKIAPFPDHITKWLIEVEIPKNDIGQMYLKEGSKVVITDTLPDGLSYDLSYVWGTNDLSSPREEGDQLIWEFDAPSLEEQESTEGSVFTRTIEVWLRANMDTEKTYQKNKAEVKATFINDVSISDESEDSIYIYGANGDSNSDGFPLIPPHFAPANGEGQMGASDDFLLEVYDDAWLKFGLGIGALYEGQYHDFEELSYSYTIDQNLILTGITTPGKWRYYPDSDYYPPNIDFNELEKLEKNPTFDIYANVNGQEKRLVENAESSKYYSRVDLNLNEEDIVTNIEYRFTYAPKGLFATVFGTFDFSVKKGYLGQVENYFTISGYGGHYQNPEEFYYDTRDQSDLSIPPWSYPRKVTIIEKPDNAYPIATVGVALQDNNNGEVIYGPNRMEVTFDNRSTSAYSMQKDLEAVVLLPIGVKISDTPNDEYSNDNGGTYEVIDNYNETGRQLVKFTWSEEYLRYQQSLKAWIDVDIIEGHASSLKFDVYGFSGDKELRVPSTNGTSITDTILQTDEDDLNGDGITDQTRLKSGNIYTIRGEYNLQTEKWVKGELDEDWTDFGQTVPGGTIDYKLNLTNTTGKDISTMTLIDVLPSVGDLGITDNIARGSQFTPLMTGPIQLPTEWNGKVSVYYSTAKNPERDDLIKNTKYPETTTPLSNPEGVEAANWMIEADVEDWSKVHSFKIELNDGETWVKGVDMDIIFSMVAPNCDDVDPSLLDKDVDPEARAAWNSFAVATDHGQPVEPAQVGVYMNQLGSIEVTKVDKESKEVLANAEFELRNEKGEVISTEKTDSKGKLTFADLKIGKYQLVETNAPEGYRLLTKPIDIEITCENLDVQIEVENSKSGWELPRTGGIGTALFYSLGALLMLGALFLMLRRKKQTKQTED
ncbi:MAG TPA: prealbumin-like fold domain-containing protein [Cerasibacillus sp.]|uniref:prealbumin-like fold domain-containing protein n=1 Tax=Cerasibacillus sp. TaxID=2498711 RepID=UPI002F4144BC